MSPDQAQTDEACWSNISQSVDAYLKESKTFIEECSRVTGMESFTPDEEAEAAFNSPVDSPVKSPTQSGTRSHQRGTPKKGNKSISQDKSSNTSNLSDASKLSDSSTTSDKSNWSSDTTASRETTATSISAQSSVDPDQARHRKNVDSGISLSVTDERPISAGSKDSGYHSPGSRPLPPLPVKTASKFGRLTRSLRKMNDRRRAAGVIEIDEEPQPLKSRPTDRFAGPRKMQPTEVFGGRKMSNPLVATTIDMYPERQASLAGALQQGPSLSPGFWRPRSPQYYNQYSTPNLKV